MNSLPDHSAAERSSPESPLATPHAAPGSVVTSRYAPCELRDNGECWTCGCCADPNCCDDSQRCLGSRRVCGAVIGVQGGEPVFCGAIESVHGDALGQVTGHDFDAVLTGSRTEAT